MEPIKLSIKYGVEEFRGPYYYASNPARIKADHPETALVDVLLDPAVPPDTLECRRGDGGLISKMVWPD
jgi:hypothetical protein